MKIFIVLFEKIELLKQNYRITYFSDFCFFAFWDISVCLICKWSRFLRHTCIMTYRRRFYIFTFIEQNHFEGIMYVCFSRNTKHMQSLKWFRLIMTKLYTAFFDKSLCTCDVETLIICISNKLKYLKNKAKKQKSSKEFTL